MSALIAALRRIEARLAPRAGLRRVTVAPELAEASGEWRGAAVSLAARAWQSLPIRYARSACIAGGDLEIANLLCLPDPLLAVPMVGIDLVQMRRGEALVVADLLPPTRASYVGHGLQPGPNDVGRADARPLQASRLPDWCRPYFSRDPIVLRVTMSELDAALLRVDRLVDRFAEMLDAAVADPLGAPARRRHQDEYCRVHREEDRALGLLARMFGDEWAESFISSVLFPIGARPDAEAGERLARLRAACRADHERLESLVDLVRDDVTVDDYARFLEASAACVAPIERSITRLAASAGDRLGPARRAKTPRLAADLAALRRAWPAAADVPAIDDWADAFGCAYVLEGATLGGQVLARHLSRTPATSHVPQEYLRAYGSETGAMWKDFLASLTAFIAADPHAAARVTAAARRTFASFSAAFISLPSEVSRS